MRAVVFDSRLHFTADAPIPDPRGHEIPVDVLQAGICETDLQLCQGYMGFRGILGHEFVGIAPPENSPDNVSSGKSTAPAITVPPATADSPAIALIAQS